jgi:SAM-dependent methyltransferase
MKLRPVAGGYDPVPLDHARRYTQTEWEHFNPVMVDTLEEKLGGFAGKRILDLGGGPAQFSIEFAKRGGVVTWHDVSRNYLSIVQELARTHGVVLNYSLGYLEEASRLVSEPFDLVFNRICWIYCTNDFRFARLIHDLIRPGGWGYINSDHALAVMGPLYRFRLAVNARTGIKLGHVVPPAGRLEQVFRGFGDLDVEARVVPPKEHIFLKKQG